MEFEVKNILQDVYQQVCTNYSPQFLELKERNETDSRKLLRSGEKSREIITRNIISLSGSWPVSVKPPSQSGLITPPPSVGNYSLNMICVVWVKVDVEEGQRPVRGVAS